MFKVVEAFTEGKRGAAWPEANDDAFITTNDFAAAIDGVSGPDGRAAMLIVKETLSELLPTATEREFAALIARNMQARFGEPVTGQRMAAATAVILSHSRSELWFYGDPQAVLVRPGGTYEKIMPEIAGVAAMCEVRKRLNLIAIEDGALANTEALFDKDPGYAYLDEMHNRQHVLANLEHLYGYTVLCAKAVPAAMALVVPVADEVAEVILMSDGYPLGLMEHGDFGGLEQAELALGRINRQDAHCMGVNLGIKGIMRNPSNGELNANYDDRSYVRLVRQAGL